MNPEHADPRTDLVRISQALEHLSALLAPVATPGNKARISKDEAFAALSWTVAASDAVRRLAVAMCDPRGEA